jgi:hypothetical protein
VLYNRTRSKCAIICDIVMNDTWSSHTKNVHSEETAVPTTIGGQWKLNTVHHFHQNQKLELMEPHCGAEMKSACHHYWLKLGGRFLYKFLLFLEVYMFI